MDTFVVNGKIVEIRRKRWKLKPGVVPHIFPNLPKYFTKPHMKRVSPNDRCREIQTHKKRFKKMTDVRNVLLVRNRLLIKMNQILWAFTEII